MATKEIIINAEKDQTRIAIVEDGKLAELFIESPENERTIGDICLGRVRRVMPSIQAAFVDIGQDQDAFLHFSDLAETLPEQLKYLNDGKPSVAKLMKQQSKKDGSSGKGKNKRRSREELSSLLQRGQRLLVKIVKEPISHKGSRVSTDISLAGRFLVLIPFVDYVAVSNKITSNKEKRRLKALAKSLLPEGFGVIVRTAAAGKNAKALDVDLRLLKEKWDALEKKLQGKPKPPLDVHEDVNMVSSIMRDLFTTEYDRVLIDYPRLYRNIKSYIQAVAPQMASSVRLHKSKKPIFEATNIDQAVAVAFKSRVQLPSGGYLFIEHTEAMHVIDVNSGASGRGMSQEESSLKVNLEAARTIATQTRLRDMGGILVVDFIDLRSSKNRRKVYEELKKEFKKDRAVSKILPMSDFGLIQITRQRLRPSLTKAFSGPDGSSAKKDSKKNRPAPTPPLPPQPIKRTEEEPPEEEKAPSQPTPAPEETLEEAPAPQPASKEPAPPTLQPEELIEKLEEWITSYKSQGGRRSITLQVHPFTAAYLNRRVPNYPTRWFMKHLVRVRLETDSDMEPAAYQFRDPRSGEDVTDHFANQVNGQADYEVKSR